MTNEELATLGYNEWVAKGGFWPGWIATASVIATTVRAEMRENCTLLASWHEQAEEIKRLRGENFIAKFKGALMKQNHELDREVRTLRQQLVGEKEAYQLSDRIATSRMHQAEQEAATAREEITRLKEECTRLIEDNIKLARGYRLAQQVYALSLDDITRLGEALEVICDSAIRPNTGDSSDPAKVEYIHILRAKAVLEGTPIPTSEGGSSCKRTLRESSLKEHRTGCDKGCSEGYGPFCPFCGKPIIKK